MDCSWRRLFGRGLEFHVCTIHKSAYTKKVWKLIVCTSYFDLAWELRKLWNGDTNCNWHAWNSLLKPGNGAGRVGNRKTYRDYRNYSIIKISQTTETSSGNMRRLTVTQIPARDQQLTLMWKNHKEWNNSNIYNDTDHLIPARRPYLLLVKKKIIVLCILKFHRVKMK